MIVGAVTAEREAVILLSVIGPGGASEFEAVIDTGFNGFLSLPSAMIHRLGLAIVGPTRATLGDGTEAEFSVYRGKVLWEEAERPVEILEAEGGVLVGMALLDGFDLHIEVRPGGRVTIQHR